MKKFIVLEKDNYADEFDLEGFKLIEANSKEEIEKSLSTKNKWGEVIEYPYSSSFGTNEEMEYESKEDLLNALEIKEITEEQYNSLIFVFGENIKRYAFGTTAII